MPSRSKQVFSCFWQPSLRLSWAVLLVSGLGCLAAFNANISTALRVCVCLALCGPIVQQLYLLQYRQTPQLKRGLRYCPQGWQLWSAKQGWQPIQLRGDSMAIPALVLVRYRHSWQRFYRSALIPADSLPQDSHRRLRLRLKFSRQRWQGIK